MTGQVKEDILVRFGELGIFVKDGKLSFNPLLIRKEEFLRREQAFEYRTCRNDNRKNKSQPGQLAFTCCQVPVVYSLSATENITVHYENGSKETVAGQYTQPGNQQPDI